MRFVRGLALRFLFDQLVILGQYIFTMQVHINVCTSSSKFIECAIFTCTIFDSGLMLLSFHEFVSSCYVYVIM